MAEAVRTTGVEMIGINVAPSRAQSVDDVCVAAHGIPDDHARAYAAEELLWHDPSQRHCRHARQPYLWRDAPFDPVVQPKAVRVRQLAAQNRLDGGLTVPVHAPDGLVGHVWLGNHDLDVEERDWPALHLAAYYAFLRLYEFSAMGARDRLTVRERQVLTCVAQGHSADEIAAFYGLSRRTVEWHMRAAVQKLGARSGANAVAKALDDGLIAL